VGGVGVVGGGVVELVVEVVVLVLVGAVVLFVFSFVVELSVLAGVEVDSAEVVSQAPAELMRSASLWAPSCSRARSRLSTLAGRELI
jgi:hypothetical protein